MAKGRKTGGRQKGYKFPKTIEKELERERVRQLVCAQLEPLVLAQIRNALGMGHLMLRDPETGKFERFISEGQTPEVEAARLDAALKLGKSAVWISTKDPSTAAFTDLMNRVLDKPAEQLKVTGAEGGPLEIVIKKPW